MVIVTINIPKNKYLRHLCSYQQEGNEKFMGKTDLKTTSKDETINQILIASLIAAVRPGKLSFQYKELLDSYLTPTKHLSGKILSMLAESAVIEIDEHPLTKSLSVQFLFLNNNMILKQLIETLRSCVIPRTGRVESLIQDVMAAECQQFIAYVASPYGITTDVDFPPHPLLIELLCYRPMKEVHMLLWRSVKKAMEQDGRLLVATNNTEMLFERVIKDAYRLDESYRESNSPISSFDRSGKFKRSALASVIFEYVLGCGNSYYGEPNIFINGNVSPIFMDISTCKK